MELKVQLKQAGKKENRIVTAKLILNGQPETVRELIEYTVIATHNAYESRQKKRENIISGEGESILLFSEEEMADMAAAGKIGFDFLKNDRTISQADAIETAIQSFEDGISALFIDGERYEDLDEALELDGTEILTFVKLAMLAGRMW